MNKQYRLLAACLGNDGVTQLPSSSGCNLTLYTSLNSMLYAVAH